MAIENLDEIESFRFVKAGRKLLKPVISILESFASNKTYNDELRLECLLALGKIGDPQSLQVLINAFEEFYDYVEPITALGYFKSSTPVQKLLDRLQDPDALYKDEIVRVLGEIGDPMATKILTELLHDEDRMVRYYSARALYSMGGRDVVQALCGLLNDPDEWIVINVLDILSRMKDIDAIPALVGQFETAKDARLKAIIISSLASFGSEGNLLKTFENALDSYDPRIQANAVEAIAQLKIPGNEMKRKLKKFYGHPNNRVRANLCIALAKWDTAQVIKELESMIESGDPPTRRSAAYVLAKIDNPKRAEYIHKLLGDSNQGVRKTALRAALTLEDAVGKKEIIPLLNDESEWVRREAVECALKINNFPNEEILEKFKNENSSSVIEVLLKYIVAKNLTEASDMVFAQVKKEVEEETEWLISALGHLGARDKLLEAKKLLGPVRVGVYSEYYVALLQNGENKVFGDIEKGFSDKKRTQDMIVYARIAGAVGALLRNTNIYSKTLKKMLAKEVYEDMKEIETFDIPSVSLEQLVEQGKTFYSSKDYNRAKEVLHRVVSKNPKNIEAGYLLGCSLYYLGDMQGAESVLTQVLNQVPNNIEVGIVLGQVYFRTKNWIKLSSCYQKLKQYLKSDEKKNIIKIYGALGLAYYNQRKYKEAIEALNTGLKANSRDLSSTYHLALCHYSLGEIDKAKQILEGLRGTLPADSQVLKNVLELLQRM